MSQGKHFHINIGLFILYIIGITAVMIWQGIGIAPDRYGIVLLIGAFLIGRAWAFLMDWTPFLFILLSYDFLRGFADSVGDKVHYAEMINFDKFFFQGQILTIWLQRWFFVPGRIDFLDLLATIFYFLHFALPLGFAFLLWLKDKYQFRKFIVALTLLSYGAFFTYIIFPAAPPWLASQNGYTPQVYKTINSTLNIFPDRLHLPTVYADFNPNPVAAIPSLHAAYPLLVLLFAYNFYNKKALWFLPYVFLVWFSIIYLGEHYFMDVVIGAIYAITSFYLTRLLFSYFQKKTFWVNYDILKLSGKKV